MTIENILLSLNILILTSKLFINSKNNLLRLFNKLIPAILILTVETYRIVNFKIIPFFKIFDIILIIAFLLILKESLMNITAQKFIRAYYIFIIILITVAIILPSKYKLPSTIPPVLNSIFFYLHVPFYIISYFFLFSAFAFCLLLFLKNTKYNWIDKTIHTDARISFFFMNLGLITGAIWADNTWGNFWSWDPKENLSLSIILLFGLFFHTKRVKIKSLIIILTTTLVFYNLILLNLVASGLHSY